MDIPEKSQCFVFADGWCRMLNQLILSCVIVNPNMFMKAPLKERVKRKSEN
jgi:hypothetical protein